MHADKRSFFHALLAGLGAGALATPFMGSARAEQAGGWVPAREPQDRWLDDISGRHRQLFDTITPEGVARALTFTYTFYAANKDAYGIEPKDLGVVMILRSGSTPYGFNDKIWAKYGTALFGRTKLADPVTKAAPVVNLYNAPDKAAQLPTNGLTLDTLTGMGGRFAVCSVSSRKLAAALAQETGGSADSVLAELQGNLVSGARLVPAGIVALNRAQERHFSLCYTG